MGVSWLALDRRLADDSVSARKSELLVWPTVESVWMVSWLSWTTQTDYSLWVLRREGELPPQTINMRKGRR